MTCRCSSSLGTVAVQIIIGLRLRKVAVVHTAAAFLMIAFFVVHACMATTGETIFTYTTESMITGGEEVEEEV